MITLLIVNLLLSAMPEGNSAMDRKDYGAAVVAYREELAAHPESFEAKYKLARALAFSGKYDEAVQLYSELLADDPAHPNTDILLARGRVYTWRRQYPEAETDFLAATRKSPESADAWSALGDMYRWNDKPINAVYAYTKSIEAKPDDPRYYIVRAKSYRDAGEIILAREDIMKARSRGGDETELTQVEASMSKRKVDPDAQTKDEYPWSGKLGYDFTEFSPESRLDWREYTAIVRRRFDKGSIAVEALRAKRFNTKDEAYAFDAYLDVRPRAYLNVRYQNSSDGGLYPDFSYRAELFHGVGKGWEPSFSYDHMQFGSNNVDMYGPGIGRYLGNWYYRYKMLIIPATARHSYSNRFLARKYYKGNGDDYYELNGGFGHGGEFRRRSTIVETTRSASLGASIQNYFHPQYGFRLSVDYGDEKNSFIERGYSVSLLGRW